MKLLDDAKQLLATTLPCPWCAVKPVLKSKRVGHRDEPDRLVYLECQSCGVQKGVIVLDSEATKAEAERREVGYKMKYESAIAAVCLPRLIEVWNMRKLV